MRSTASGLLRSPQLFCEMESILIGNLIGTLTCLPSGDLPLEGLPVGALGGDAPGEGVGVGVDEVDAHAPGLVVALAGPAGDLHHLAGERLRLGVRAPAAERTHAVVDREAQGLVVLGRGRIGGPVVEHRDVADGRRPGAFDPGVGFGVADVARSEHGLRGGAGIRRVVRERRNRARKRGESEQREGCFVHVGGGLVFGKGRRPDLAGRRRFRL